MTALLSDDQFLQFVTLYRVSVGERALVAANLVAAMKHIWRDSWGPRLEYILGNTLRALLDVRSRELRPSLMAIPRLYVDADYRAREEQYRDE